MSRSKIPSADELRGELVVDADGQQIGNILGVYLDNETRQPEWLALRLPSTAITLVPVAEASLGARGLQVPFAREHVLHAPYRQAQLAQAISEEQEEALYRHYVSGDARRSTRQPPPTPAAAGAEATAGEQGVAVARGAVSAARHVGETASAGGRQVAASAARQAAAVASNAKEQAGAVAETARQQVAQVGEEASAQARELLGTTTDQIVDQAQAQLDQLAEALHRLAGQALALARGNPDMAGPVAELVGRAGAELHSVSTTIEARGSQGLLEDTQRVVRDHPTAAWVVTALALVGGAKLVASPAGDRVKTMVAPLKDQAIEAGRSVAEELKPVVQQRVEGVKAVATQAADQLKQEVQASAQDIKGTASTSASAVKATAAESASTVKRSTRAAAAARPALAH